MYTLFIHFAHNWCEKYLSTLVFVKSCLKNIVYCLKKIKQIEISLINQINIVCTFYIITSFYTLCTQLIRGRVLVPHAFKSHGLKKNYIISLKTRVFKKHHLFNKSNKQALYILHYHTLL